MKTGRGAVPLLVFMLTPSGRRSDTPGNQRRKNKELNEDLAVGALRSRRPEKDQARQREEDQ
jgi:hypothetical protein